MTAFDEEAWLGLGEVRAGDGPRPEPATLDDVVPLLERIADALEAPARPKVCGEMHNAAGKPCVLNERHVGHHASADGRLHWLDDE